MVKKKLFDKWPWYMQVNAPTPRRINGENISLMDVGGAWPVVTWIRTKINVQKMVIETLLQFLLLLVHND